MYFYCSRSKDAQIEVNYCNEFLVINIILTTTLRETDHFCTAVNRVQLNRTKLNDLDSKFFRSDETLVEKWSSDLPGLKNQC